jgi:hypothetical protein
MTADMMALSRRALLAAGGVALIPTLGFAAPALPPSRRLTFVVFRNGAKIGEHTMGFASGPDGLAVTTEVAMAIKIGPIIAFRYVHRALERWTGDHFVSLETTTDANGKTRSVSARRADGAVLIRAGKDEITGPVAAKPLTHWNAAALAGPLFNPQEGKMLKLTASTGRDTLKLAAGGLANATRWSLRGETELDDWYDEAGVWLALKGKLPDGSMMEYRRV